MIKTYATIKQEQLVEFKRYVFGAEIILEEIPALLNEEVEIQQNGDMWYIYDKKKQCFSKTSFFHKDELKCLTLKEESHS